MIVNEEDYDTYLEHFGVKGMHWGQRKAGGSGGHETAKKVVKTTAAVAVVAGGAVASAYVLKKYGAKKAIEVGMKSYAKAKTIKGVADTIKSDYGYQKPTKVPDKAMGTKVDALHLESLKKYDPPKILTSDQIAKAMKDPYYNPNNDPKPWAKS